MNSPTPRAWPHAPRLRSLGRGGRPGIILHRTAEQKVLLKHSPEALAQMAEG